MAAPTIPSILSQQACDTAIAAISAAVTITAGSPSTHDVAVISGLETQCVLGPLATYLLNCAAQTVSTNLAILNDLLGESNDTADALRSEVGRLIGDNNSVAEDFRQDHRDPWLAEGLAHLFLRIASSHPLPPPGCLHVLTPVHDDVKEHGLDLVGIYTCTASGSLGLAVSESKASENNATSHVASAAELFREVMNGQRDPHIRSKVQALRHALPDTAQALITAAFWNDEKCFSAYVAVSGSSGFDVNAARPTYSQIQPRPTIIILSLANYRGFFDGLADRMRQLIATIEVPSV